LEDGHGRCEPQGDSVRLPGTGAFPGAAFGGSDSETLRALRTFRVRHALRGFPSVPAKSAPRGARLRRELPGGEYRPAADWPDWRRQDAPGCRHHEGVIAEEEHRVPVLRLP